LNKNTMKNKCMGCLNLVFAGVFAFYTCREGHEIVDVPEKIDNGFRHHPCATKICPDKNAPAKTISVGAYGQRLIKKH